MKVEKFKVLLYLKKSGMDKSGNAPIMGRITVNRTMAQFGCKLSCKPELWNARESRLPLSILFLMLILGFGCKINGPCSSDNGLAQSWLLVAGSGVFRVTLNQSGRSFEGSKFVFRAYRNRLLPLMNSVESCIPLV